MKLKTKLTAFCIIIMVIAVAVSCALILKFNWDNALDDVTQTALADISGFCDSFFYSAGNNHSYEGIVQRSFVLNCFSGIPGSHEYTLLHDGEYLRNNAGFSAEALLETTYSTDRSNSIRYGAARAGGSYYFIANKGLTLSGEEYSVSLVRDITPLASSIQSLGLKCVTASFAIIAVSAFLMWFIVRLSIKPIDKLKKGAHELAGGHYEKRITLKGKDELSELADDFNRMAGAVEANIHELHEKNERQQTFISDLSHELKTPVTSILLCAETLIGRKLSQEAVNSMLERIYGQGKWLEQLSQKLMTLLMLQEEIPMKEESVAGLLEAVRESTVDALREKDIELITECSIGVLPMDFDLMRSALVNLVENARKASKAGQQVKLLAHDNMIEVIDQGMGIPREEIPRITEPFYMVDRSRSKKAGGSGLGLALVKRIAEAHGAELDIESVLGKGTIVRLIFNGAKNS